MNKVSTGLFATALCLLSFNSYSGTIFSDNFDAEPSSGLNYGSFANWDISGGSVDLINDGTHGLSCFGTGKCVDLDGSSSNAGVMTTKLALDLAPGIYELSFVISGNQRGGAADFVTVSLGTVFSEVFTKAPGDPYEIIIRQVEVLTQESAYLSFDHAGSDNVGIMLDNVSLTTVPVPPALWLMVAGIAGLLGFKKSKQA